jgi:hypothetical protein
MSPDCARKQIVPGHWRGWKVIVDTANHVYFHLQLIRLSRVTVAIPRAVSRPNGTLLYNKHFS